MFIPEASNSARYVDAAFLVIVGISVALLAGVTSVMLFLIFRYNRRRGTKAEQVEGGTALEIIWTVIPVVLVMVMFVIGERSFRLIRSAPREIMTIRVDARQWSWMFGYDNGRQSDQLRVPLGKPVKLRLSSRDVLHSFYVPAFRIKEDCVPGMETYLWFTPQQQGSFDIFCTEYCGLGHSGMLAKVVVMPEKEFDEWYAGAGAKGNRGLQLLLEKGCLGCHTTDGTLKVGPTFKGIYGRTVTVVTSGKERTITVDGDYLKRSVLDPGADIVKGFPPVMPKIPVTPEELDAIEDYLEHLR